MKHTTSRGLSFALASTLFALTTHAQSADKALAAFKAGEWKQVFAAVAAVPKDSADLPKALFIAGEAHLVVGDASEAEICFRRVLETRPNAVPAKIGLGRALTQQDKLDDAEKLLVEVVKSEPKELAAKQALGELHLRAKKLDAARTELAEVLAADPKNAFASRSYCDALWAANDDENAAKVGMQLAKTLPKHPMGAFLQAVTQERLGKDEKAIELYEKALELDPTFLDAHKNLAILCHTANPIYQDAVRTEKALAHYAKYFELGGNDPELKQSYTQFKGFMDEYFGKGKGKDKKEPK